MKIAIVGCGYVGCAVASLWSREGHEIVATTTTPEKKALLEPLAARVVVLKGNDFDTLKDALGDRELVLLSVGARSANTYRETYLETAKNLVKVLKFTPSVRHLIYTGSYSVLGDKNGEWTDEESIPTPANENGFILLETERVLLDAASEKLKVCILRLAGIYGPGREIIQIFGSLSGTTRAGDGSDYINWVHLDDIVGAIEFVRSNQLQGIYNLAGDRPMLCREFFERLFRSHGKPNVIWNPSERSTRPYNTRLSNQKIEAAGYRFVRPEIEF